MFNFDPRTAREGPDALDPPWKQIHNAYDESGGNKLDPSMNLGGLATEEERLKALSVLTQTGGGDLDARGACGAATLLGGALYAGGSGGINTLLGAVIAMNKKNGGGDPKALAENAAMVEELTKLQKKLAKPGVELTAGDLGAAIHDVYGLIGITGNGGDKEGTSQTVVSELFKSSPELAKLWKEHDLSYESIDHNGDGRGDHAVLGIGHHLGDRKGKGPHEMIWDPWKRKAPGQDAAHEEVMEYERQVADRTYGPGHPRPTYFEDGKEKLYPVASPDAPSAALAEAKQREQQLVHDHPATQLITDEATLMDYWMSRTGAADIGGGKAPARR